MSPLLALLIPCVSVIVIVTIITVSCVRYYSSETKRALVTSREKYNDMENLMGKKDSEHAKILSNKEDECKRMADIIKSLMEKQQSYSVDAKIKNS